MVRWGSQSELSRVYPTRSVYHCSLFEKQKSGGIVPSIVKVYTAAGFDTLKYRQ